MRVQYKTAGGRKVIVECQTFAQSVDVAYTIQRGQIPFKVFAAVANALADGLIDATNKTAKVICQ